MEGNLQLRTILFVVGTMAIAPTASVDAQSCLDWQLEASGGPQARAEHAMVFDSARGLTVLFGGSIVGNVGGDTWEWNGTTWTQHFPVPSPSARYIHAMAYDSDREMTVLFGGLPGGDETWEWSGTTWTQHFPLTSPSARRQHAMCYDSCRHETVLFGGTSGSNETWVWNGTTWTQRFPSTSPPGRITHAMVFDSARCVTVLFGGFNSVDLGDTWEWNGTDWTQRFPANSPPAREVHSMAYDSARGVTVLFGGSAVPNPTLGLGDTWEWNGTDWTERFPPTNPPARHKHKMVYDSARSATVLFGGSPDNIALLGDTWALSGTFPCPTVSQWGLIVTCGLLAAAGRRVFGNRRKQSSRISVLHGGSHDSA